MGIIDKIKSLFGKEDEQPKATEEIRKRPQSRPAPYSAEEEAEIARLVEEHVYKPQRIADSYFEKVEELPKIEEEYNKNPRRTELLEYIRERFTNAPEESRDCITSLGYYKRLRDVKRWRTIPLFWEGLRKWDNGKTEEDVPYCLWGFRFDDKGNMYGCASCCLTGPPFHAYVPIDLVPDRIIAEAYKILFERFGDIKPAEENALQKENTSCVVEDDSLQDEQQEHLSVSPDSNPSDLFMEARAFAGNSLSEMMKKLSPDGPSPKGYRWVKAEWTYPNFEHFTFAYKNQLFSVLVDLVINGEHSLDEDAINNLRYEAERNNLNPCIFPVIIKTEGTDQELTHHNVTMSKQNSGWNLFHAETMLPVVPEQLGNDTPIQMSEWEMLDFSVKVVTRQIEQEGGEILSLCSVSEMYPNIWFVDKAGNRCWVIVERLPMSIDPKEAAKKWCEKTDYKSIEQILRYDGFHAAVDFQSSEPFLCDAQGELIPLSKREDESCPRYRGDGMYVCFRGLERIHDAER